MGWVDVIIFIGLFLFLFLGGYFELRTGLRDNDSFYKFMGVVTLIYSGLFLFPIFATLYSGGCFM